MSSTSNHLLETISVALPLLRKISDKEASFKPNPEKWSYKEIIGHLVDSAGNNQQKFIRTMEQKEMTFVPYNQVAWVKLQQYNRYNWNELLTLFEVNNKHIAHIIKYARPSVLENKITIDGVGPFTLEFIISDYVEHMRHHLKAILPNAGISSKFQNIYNS